MRVCGAGGWPRFVNEQGCHLYYRQPLPGEPSADGTVTPDEGTAAAGAGGQWFLDDEWAPKTPTRWAKIDTPDGPCTLLSPSHSPPHCMCQGSMEWMESCRCEASTARATRRVIFNKCMFHSMLSGASSC